jgi:hypothetical protein
MWPFSSAKKKKMNHASGCLGYLCTCGANEEQLRTYPQTWVFSGEQCPKCSKRMVKSRYGHQCEAYDCDYKEPKSAQGVAESGKLI